MLTGKCHVDFCIIKLIFENRTLAYISSENIVLLIEQEDFSIVSLKSK